MTADAEARILGELAALRRMLERITPPPTPQTRLLQALAAVYGHGGAFTSADVADALALRYESRTALRQALHAALAGKAPTPERIGRLLGGIVAAGGPAGDWTLTTPSAEGGSRVWMLVRAGD